MPTDMLRSRRPPPARPAPERGERHAGPPRRVRIRIRAGELLAELAPTVTADRLFAALPLYGAAEPWGDTLHFEVPIASGRERGARVNVGLGDICYWPREQRILVPFGPTPISRAGEIRMPEPVNVIARAIGDVGILRMVRVGERVALERLET